MGRRRASERETGRIRDIAVQAVMTRGGFESSGEARLAVLRQDGLMIAYRTPFNPLAGAKGDYGIDIWREQGKVFSASWGPGAPLATTFKPGPWQAIVESLATAAAPRRAPRRAGATEALERENRALRRVIENLTLDKLILSKAAAGEL